MGKKDSFPGEKSGAGFPRSVIGTAEESDRDPVTDGSVTPLCLWVVNRDWSRVGSMRDRNASGAGGKGGPSRGGEGGVALGDRSGPS